jgi:hypothetical protein
MPPAEHRAASRYDHGDTPPLFRAPPEPACELATYAFFWRSPDMMPLLMPAADSRRQRHAQARDHQPAADAAGAPPQHARVAAPPNIPTCQRYAMLRYRADSLRARHAKICFAAAPRPNPSVYAIYAYGAKRASI